MPTLIKQVTNGEYDRDSDDWKKLTQEAKDFIQGLLDVNPETRFTTKQALA